MVGSKQLFDLVDVSPVPFEDISGERSFFCVPKITKKNNSIQV